MVSSVEASCRAFEAESRERAALFGPWAAWCPLSNLSGRQITVILGRCGRQKGGKELIG